MDETSAAKTTIDDIKLEFERALSDFKKDECMEIVRRSLEKGYVSIDEMYLEILSPSLSSIAGNKVEQKIDIWQEHLTSSIVRTMIEICYPFVISLKISRNIQTKGSIILSCLDDEQHDIGARMISDLLLLRGYDVFFIGANTAKEQMLKAYNVLKPDFCAVSISNYYHLTRLQKAIDYLKGNTNGECKIIVGGYAISNTPDIESKVFPDIFIKNMHDLDKLAEVGR